MAASAQTWQSWFHFGPDGVRRFFLRLNPSHFYMRYFFQLPSLSLTWIIQPKVDFGQALLTLVTRLASRSHSRGCMLVARHLSLRSHVAVGQPTGKTGTR